MQPTSGLTLALITPARNEEAFIEQTIQSVLAQKVRPVRWIIVSDASSDATDAIVNRYLRLHPWMELIRMPEVRDRSFGAKAQCFAAGFARLQGVDFDIVGNLDADITLGEGYFEYLLEQFRLDPALGVAGTPFVEGALSYDFRFTSRDHVSGACQLFRRACYENIGGYPALPSGGIDWVAVTTARMKGWKTRTFTEKVCYHHRVMGTASSGKLKANFRLGRQDYYLGGHPLWQLSRGLYQTTRSPYVLGGILLIAGYAWAWLTRVPRPVSGELIRFHRSEQLARLRQMFRRAGPRLAEAEIPQ